MNQESELQPGCVTSKTPTSHSPTSDTESSDLRRWDKPAFKVHSVTVTRHNAAF